MTSSNGNIFRVTGRLCGEFTGEFPTQRPVTRSFDVFFDLRLNKRLSKQPWGWWFETPSWSLWRQCNEWERRHIPEIRSLIQASWRLKSLAARLFVKHYIQAHNNEQKSKLRIIGTLWSKSPAVDGFPLYSAREVECVPMPWCDFVTNCTLTRNCCKTGIGIQS